MRSNSAFSALGVLGRLVALFLFVDIVLLLHLNMPLQKAKMKNKTKKKSAKKEKKKTAQKSLWFNKPVIYPTILCGCALSSLSQVDPIEFNLF
jgi:hypothetical protein